MSPSPIPAYPKGHNLLAGKSVLVTAAAGTGIGFATAKRCAEEGARVMLSDKHERRLIEYSEKLAAEIGRPVASEPCDVTAQADVERLFARAEREFGGLDVLVNNAGLGGTAAICDMTDEQWLRVLDVTLNGTFRCTRAALKQMIPRGRGSIVNLGSVVAWRAQAEQAHYSAAKAGVLALTRAAAMEAAPHGVRVNAVVPSLAIHANLAKVTTDELLAELTAREAMGRSAEPFEVANAIVYLASDLASFITGESLSVSNQHP
jgi:3-oxoacyl-[acyl-carrier protein] reductase